MPRLSPSEQGQIASLINLARLDLDVAASIRQDFREALSNWSESASVPGTTCAAAYTSSGGRDTGHAVCGSAVGPVSLDWEKVDCPDCEAIMEGWED